jgi:hypothetical protein
MIAFALGIIFGMTFGLLLMGVLSLGAYDRGFDAANRTRAARLPTPSRRRTGSGDLVSARRIA